MHEIKKEGYLLKESKHFGIKRKRYIVLQQNALYSYKPADENPMDAEPTEIIKLKKYIGIKHSLKNHQFMIYDEHKRSRNFYADTTEDMFDWIDNIKDRIPSVDQTIYNYKRKSNESTIINKYTNHNCSHFNETVNVNVKGSGHTVNLFGSVKNEEEKQLEIEKSINTKSICKNEDVEQKIEIDDGNINNEKAAKMLKLETEMKNENDNKTEIKNDLESKDELTFNGRTDACLQRFQFRNASDIEQIKSYARAAWKNRDLQKTKISKNLYEIRTNKCKMLINSCNTLFDIAEYLTIGNDQIAITISPECQTKELPYSQIRMAGQYARFGVGYIGTKQGSVFWKTKHFYNAGMYILVMCHNKETILEVWESNPVNNEKVRKEINK
eukprot:322864_1